MNGFEGSIITKMANLLDKEIEKLCRANRVAGTNIALFNKNEILYTYNYGYINKELKLKSTNDSLYMIGSNTKILTALCIFKLLENHELSLDDDIKQYIPEFEVKSFFEYEKITVENLLMHRSGLIADLYHITHDTPGGYYAFIEALKDTYLTSVPGHMFSYSNVGYTLLGIIIERISGMTYCEYVKKTIADPLGIHIHFLKNEAEKEEFSSVLSLNYNKKGKAVVDFTSTLACTPAGTNTYMTMNDFVKLGQVFLNKDENILKKETIERMEKLNVKEEIDHKAVNIGYGLIHNQYNFGEEIGKVLGHGGDTICHHSMFNYIPDLDIGVAVFTNSEQAVLLSRTLGLKLLLKSLERKGYRPGNENSTEHIHTQINCDNYVGKFATGIGLIDIKKNKKQELVTKISKFSVKLIPCEDGFLQCYPNQLLLELPAIKKKIKGIRLQLINYGNEEVLMLEQTSKNNKTLNIAGCRYSDTTIPKTFQDACGDYEITNKKLNALNWKCSLKTENARLKLEIEVLGSKMEKYLNVIDDEKALTQGFGKYAREVMRIKKDNDHICFIYNGLTFQKARD